MRTTIRGGLAIAAVGLGIITIAPPVSSQPFTCDGLAATIIGTPSADLLTGTSGDDVIVALGGADRIDGLSGDDHICGGDGRDRLIGGTGDDVLIGGRGNDRLLGRAGRDVLIGGAGTDVLRGGTGRDSGRGGRGVDSCREVEQSTSCSASTTGNPRVDRVIHISIDGLRADHVIPALMPKLTELFAQGASTLNARTDPAFTQTLPNHTSQFTGRPVRTAAGHGVDYNTDLGRTVHAEAGEYVASVFDVVHDSGARTAMYVGKRKFEMHDRTWNGANGARDLTGADNGRDKIDFFVRDDPADAVEVFLTELRQTRELDFSFYHIRSPDEFGHTWGWDTPGYRDGVREADEILGQIFTAVRQEADWRDTTAIIVTSDHGGPSAELFHNDEQVRANFVVPFGVWAPGVVGGSDLYELNSGRRTDPSTSQPPLNAPQPIRTHEVANLALDLLGLPPVPGSVFNVAQDLVVR